MHIYFIYKVFFLHKSHIIIYLIKIFIFEIQTYKPNHYGN